MSKAPKFTAGSLPNLSGKTVIITGANSGIGLVAAGAIAGAGARVVLAVRSERRGLDAIAALKAASPDRELNLEVRELDLANLASIRDFAVRWYGPIEILINNAGVMIPPPRRTADGFELQLGTNHLGHFALTNLLLGRVEGRVVTVSSNAHRLGEIDFTDLNYEHRHYQPMTAYAQSKLANMLFCAELQRRLDAVSSPVLSLAAHPGYAATNLTASAGTPLLRAILKVSDKLLAQSAEQGALPTIYAATQPLPGDTYVGPSGFQEWRGSPHPVVRSTRAADPELAKHLWDVSERLTGVKFPL